MKPIKKFSMMAKAEDSINESAEATHDAVMDLVKKMGYESVEELKKEKNLLTKLEGLIKDASPKQDISEEEIEEDRAEDIADEVKKKGTPKSLEDKEDKEESKVDTEGEVAETEDVEEDAAEEIEDEVLAKGEPKDVEDKAGDKVSDDPAITAEVPAEADEVEDKDGVEVAAEEEETPAATKRIMAFEDFIKEKEVTVNKNVKYHDDDEEPEDYAVPVAASAKPLAEDDDEDKGEDDEKKGDELEDKGDVKVDHEDDKEKEDHYKGAVKSDDAEIDALKKDVEYDKEKEDDDDDDKNESRIMSFANFVTESYEDVKEEEEEVEAEEEEAVEEAVGEVITKVEGDEIADEEAGDDGLAIPAEKGDGSETAAGIAGDIMDMGKVKVQPESKGEELVTKDQNITAEVKGEADDLKDATEVPAEMGDGSETAAGIAGDIMNMGKVKAQPESKGEALVGEAKINEKDITSADEFKEYAMAILKDAFGDDFDETKATETADGLLKKYGEDYGAMVGALQSTMGS